MVTNGGQAHRRPEGLPSDLLPLAEYRRSAVKDYPPENATKAGTRQVVSQ